MLLLQEEGAPTSRLPEVPRGQREDRQRGRVRGAPSERVVLGSERQRVGLELGDRIRGRGSGRAEPSQAPHLEEEAPHDPSAGEDEEAYSDYTYAEENEEEEAAERDSERSPSVVRPGPAVQAALRETAKHRARGDLPSAVRPRGSADTFVPAVAPRAKAKPKERPRVFPGSTDGRCLVWPLAAEQVFFEMAEQLVETNMSGYTEKFDREFVKRLQRQEGQVGLSHVPTIALRQAAVAEFLRAMGIAPTKPPAPDFRSKQYR